MAALLAILGWLSLGLALTAIAWALSWLLASEWDELDALDERESAADREYRFGRGSGSRAATDRRKGTHNRTIMVVDRTHDKRGL